MLGELENEKMISILTSQVKGRLACSDGMFPYIVPVTYTYNDKYIYGQTNFGKKLDILRNNPNVCFEVDLMTDMRNWQSVIVYGSFEELEGKEAEKAKELLYNRVFQLMTSSTVHTHQHEVNTNVDDNERIKNVMYRIKIKKMTGRFEHQ